MTDTFAPHLAAVPQLHRRFTALKDHLLEIIGDRPVCYVPNPGNMGDGLIRHATLLFLADSGIACREYREGFNPGWARHCSDAVFLFGGGGAWCHFWSHSIDVVKAAAPLFHHVVILPSTYELGCDVQGVTFFARDNFQSLVAQPRAIFCDDMAFYLYGIDSSPGSGTGHFFRRDAEGARRFRLPDDNDDIAAHGNHLSAPDVLFDALRPLHRIRTDRLHVAILGALLGKRVHLHAGAYFKNRAVYESSMRNDFPHVSFYEKRAPR
jgi:hypothetical protein